MKKKCISVTHEGTRCSKTASKGRDLCHIHLRDSVDPKPYNPNKRTKVGRALLDLDDSFDDIDVGHITRWLAAVITGDITESKTLGGSGGIAEVPASTRDRLSAATLLIRLKQQTSGDSTDVDEAFEALKRVLDP